MALELENKLEVLEGGLLFIAITQAIRRLSSASSTVT